MKNDGRKFDRKTLETLRLMAVQRVREGERPSAVIVPGVLPHDDLQMAPSHRQAGRRSESPAGETRDRPASHPHTASGVAGVPLAFHWVNGKDPREYGLDFGLWTRGVVADLIERKFGIELGLTAMGALLAKLEITPQKPLQRAYQRDPQAIEKWQKATFPGIRRQAKTKGAEVFFWDESGFRADAVHGRSWGLKGHTPVVERPGQRQSISAASAVSVRGGFWYCVHARSPAPPGQHAGADRRR